MIKDEDRNWLRVFNSARLSLVIGLGPKLEELMRYSDLQGKAAPTWRSPTFRITRTTSSKAGWVKRPCSRQMTQIKPVVFRARSPCYGWLSNSVLFPSTVKNLSSHTIIYARNTSIASSQVVNSSINQVFRIQYWLVELNVNVRSQCQNTGFMTELNL